MQQRWPLALNSVLLLLFAWLVAQWTWLMVLPKPRQLLLFSASSSSSFAVEEIPGYHLFGQMAGLDTASPAQQKTISNLKLQGVFAAIGSLPAFAIVSADGKAAQPIQVGKEIVPGVVMEGVYPDYVVLRRNGIVERLNLEMNSLQSIKNNIGQEEFKLNVQARGGNMFSFSRNELNQALQDTKQLMNLGQLSPYPAGGMMVDNAPPGSLADKLGLRPGDVVQRFNNQPLSSNADVQKFMQQLQHVAVVRLNIMRGGGALQLKYDIQ